MNSCHIPLNTIRQTLLLNQDCSCGIAAILESRRCSQMASTGKLVKIKGKLLINALRIIIYKKLLLNIKLLYKSKKSINKLI